MDFQPICNYADSLKQRHLQNRRRFRIAVLSEAIARVCNDKKTKRHETWIVQYA